MAEVFRYLLTSKTISDKVMSEYEFVFKTVFYTCGPSYCYCRCAYDHEYFSYISDTGDVDMGILDRLATVVKDGYCQHTIGLTEKGYLRETRVNVFHIAAALGSEELTETFTSGLNTGTINVRVMNSELLNLHPFDIAVIKGNVIVSRLLSNFHPPIQEDRSWDYPIIIHASEKERGDVLLVEKTPFLELCITERDLPMLEMLFKTLEPPRPALRPRIYELLFQNNLTNLIHVILEITMTEHEQWRSRGGLDTDPHYDPKDLRRYKIFKDVPIIAELAVIYSQRDIFEKSLQLLSEGRAELDGNPLLTVCSADGQPLIRVCEALKRRNFYKPLLQEEVQHFNRTHPTSNVSNFVYLYCLLTRFTFSGKYIKHAMELLPNIGEIINVPLDTTSQGHANSEGLTPLQWYVLKELQVEQSVVRILIELGADIDKEYPQDKLLSSCPKNVAILSEGQSLPLCVCIFKENTRDKLEWRSILELLLYENVSIGINKSIVAFGLKHYKHVVLRDSRAGSMDRVHQAEEIEPGAYFMDSTLHESALDFAVPLLIEAGFHYTCADIDEALRLSNDSEEERERLHRSVTETGSHHTLEKNYVLAFLERCMSEPRTLKLRCRDVLRTYFPGRQIHRIVSSVDIPKTIKDYLLLKPILQTLPDDI